MSVAGEWAIVEGEREESRPICDDRRQIMGTGEREMAVAEEEIERRVGVRDRL